MKTSHVSLTLAVILVTILLSSCGGTSLKDPLNNSAWVLTSIDNMSPLEKTAVTVEFTEGKIGGSSGCNSYGGSYKVKGEKITTDSIAMTLMACVDPEIMEQEQVFLGYLQDAQTYKLGDGHLQIFRSDGKNLTFIPKS
jgi:heat shock protein HslJ